MVGEQKPGQTAPLDWSQKAAMDLRNVSRP